MFFSALVVEGGWVLIGILGYGEVHAHDGC